MTSLVIRPVHVPRYGSCERSGADGFEREQAIAPVSASPRAATPIVRVPERTTALAIDRNETSVCTGKVNQTVDRRGHPVEPVSRVRCSPSLLAREPIERHVMT